MNYITSILTAIIIFPIVASIFTIPFILIQYHKYGSINKFRVLIIYSFILYLITIYFLVILPLPHISEVIKKTNMIRLIPFGFINDFIKESPFKITNPNTYLKSIIHPSFYTVVFNIFMTIPLGMYLRYYFKCNLKKTISISFMISLFFEITQITGLYYIYPYPYRVFDIDDLFMNTTGGVVGYLFIGLFLPILPTRDKIDEESYKNGEVVSGLRRITLFTLDIVIFIFLTALVSVILKTTNLFLIIFLIYYIIYPYFNNNQTIGSKFLNVKLDFNNYRLIKLSLRIVFIFSYYFGTILIMISIALIISKYSTVNLVSKLWIYNILIRSIIAFYIGNIFIIMKTGKIYYDKFLKVEYKSTINEEIE